MCHLYQEPDSLPTKRSRSTFLARLRRHLWRPHSTQELECPASDIDPSEARIKRSVQLVARWFARCEFALAAGGDVGDGSGSVVSLIGGEIMKRPALDVGSWKPLSHRGSRVGSRTEDKELRMARGFFTTAFSHRQRDASGDDCVYDKLPQAVYLDRRDAGRRRSHKGHEALQAPLFGSLKGRLSKKYSISSKGAMEVLGVKKHRKEEEYMMSGGLSPLVGSIKGINAIDRDGQTQAIKSSWTAGLDSQSTTGEDLDFLSSRPSATNMGSLINLEPSQSQGSPSGHFNQSYFDFNPHSSGHSSYSSFRPRTPKPIGGGASPDQNRHIKKRSGFQSSSPLSPLIPVAPKFTASLRTEAQQLNEDYSKHFAAGKIESGYQSSVQGDAARERRRRRANRQQKVSMAETYRLDERQKFWGLQR